MRTIDGDALAIELQNALNTYSAVEECGNLTEFAKGRITGLTTGILAARNAPTVRIEFGKRGVWKLNRDSYECSECGAYVEIHDDESEIETSKLQEVSEFMAFKKAFRYCAHCGARLE